MRALGILTAVVLTGGLMAAPIPKDKEKPKKDEEAILGTWQLEKFDGPDPLPPDLGPLRLILKAEGKVAVSTGNNGSQPGTYKLNSSAKVKELDIHLADDNGPTLAIYELNGDVLRVATADAPKEPRPTEFKSDKKVAVMTFKRVVEEKK